MRLGLRRRQRRTFHYPQKRAAVPMLARRPSSTRSKKNVHGRIERGRNTGAYPVNSIRSPKPSDHSPINIDYREPSHKPKQKENGTESQPAGVKPAAPARKHNQATKTTRKWSPYTPSSSMLGSLVFRLLRGRETRYRNG